MLMPYRQDTWREKAVPAQEAFTNVIKAIAQHEKVVVGINPSLYKKLAPSFRMIPNVEPISIRYNDAWARDNMPSS
jgi:agmatine deiminase